MKDMRLETIARIVAMVFLLGAIPEALPYGFYVLLRWVVLATAVLLVRRSYFDGRVIWSVIFALIGLLFNPVVPVHLDKSMWVAIDVVTIVVLAISLFTMQSQESGGST